MSEIKIGKRKIGTRYPPFVIVEVGINHEGSMAKAKRMIRDAQKAGAECVKFQSHVVEDEMVSRDSLEDLTPSHATESVWDIIKRCAFNEKQERELKKYTEKLGMIYLCTPFSRAAADRLKRMNVQAYKIGSGECNNYPLIEYIASFKKPMIVSTGMNTTASIKKTVVILRKHKVPYALLNCTSMYPAPHNKVRLKGIQMLQKAFKDAVVGQSDHSLGVYTCLGAVALGASILEKHFTSDKKWPGPDIPVSIDPVELKELIVGSRAVWEAMGERTGILKEEQEIINFAYASVVSITDIKKGEKFTKKNIWVKRPGTGEIKAIDYPKVLGKRANKFIAKDSQVKKMDIA
ncbi:MAG: N-acetylneuraminate synthase family protein [bacterium]|nr:N-acetylneuraminate synthase family protein [bacterium]